MRAEVIDRSVSTTVNSDSIPRRAYSRNLHRQWLAARTVNSLIYSSLTVKHVLSTYSLLYSTISTFVGSAGRSSVGAKEPEAAEQAKLGKPYLTPVASNSGSTRTSFLCLALYLGWPISSPLCFFWPLQFFPFQTRDAPRHVHVEIIFDNTSASPPSRSVYSCSFFLFPFSGLRFIMYYLFSVFC
jgi:hypothetical protein